MFFLRVLQGLLVTASIALAGAGTSYASVLAPAHYIVFEVDAAGIARPVHATRVTTHGTIATLAIGSRARATERSADAVEVRLRNAAGQVVFESVVGIPRFLRGEFHGVTGVTIDGHHIREPNRAFAVRVPSVTNADLELSSPAFAQPAHITLDASFRAAESVGSRATVVSGLPGWSNGDPANRVDLLVVGDGYTAAEESKFHADALTVVEGMFSITPYAEYRNYVNVQTLFVASAQSGADQPPYAAGCADYGRAQTCCADPPAASETPTAVDTAFDATFCSFNIERLLTVNNSKVLVAADAAPDWDQILVIVNTSRYGGSGGGFSVISTNGAAIEVAQHEYGHTFSRLADEYSSPYPGYPPCSDVSVGAAPCEPNVTDQTTRSLIKWEKWIDPAQPVPSTSSPPVPTNAGLWLGARYKSTGMYRQGNLCIMRALGTPFCDVAAEAYAIRLYEGAWGAPAGGIDLIEPGSESPPPGTVIAAFPGLTHSARVLGPVGGPGVSFRWALDDIDVSEGAAAPGDIVSYTMTATPGIHTLQLRVIDTSTILHPTTRPALARSRTWNVEVGPETPTTTTTSTATSTTLASTTTTSPASTTTVTTTTTLAAPTTTTVPSTTTTVLSATTTVTNTSTTLHSDPPCAQPTSSGPGPVASDCLYILNAAVGVVACTPECVCAPKGFLPASATDALVCLSAAVGATIELKCPCGPLPPPGAHWPFRDVQ